MTAIYLDYAASTPVDPRVADIMMEWLSPQNAGNPHARHHLNGGAASAAIAAARGQVAQAIGADPSQIVFTSGATEANNLGILGLADHLKSIGRTRILASAVEHKSVLLPLKYLEKQGFEIVVLPVKPCGMVDAATVKHYMDDRTGLVCVQAVNNELGVIQPLSEIRAVLNGALLLVDAAQALGKATFDVEESGADFASFAAHKCYGPQGIGALYVRNSALLSPRNFGGGQEGNGLRSGTLPVALIAGFGMACTMLEKEQDTRAMRQAFLAELGARVTVLGHSDPAWQIDETISLHIPGVPQEALVMALSDLSFGTGSACASTGQMTSYVMEAIGLTPQQASETIRISFGRFTTQAELKHAAILLADAIDDLTQLKEVA